MGRSGWTILRNKVTGEVYGRVLVGGHSVDIEHIADLLEVKIMQTEDDYMYGDGVDYEDLEIIPEE